MIGQKQAVCNTLISVLKDNEIEYEIGGELSMTEILDQHKTIKPIVQAIILEGLLANEISMTDTARANNNTEAKMKSYTSSLINNWVRKNPEFNGGQAYKPKNPGSRTGQSDETIKNLRLMKKTITDPNALIEIDKAIADRIAEIAPEKVVTVNVNAIPDHLKHLVKSLEDKVNS